jgi:hypothetical protein
MDLSTKAMLAAIHISLWTARKHDRKVSREVATLNGANEQAGRYNKRLFCEAPKLDEIQTIAGRIRQYFYRVTLPWSDEGLRILPAELYFEFNAQMRDFAAEFRYAVDEFLDAYDTYVKEAQPMLGSLFRLKDYPPAEKVKEKFALRPEILPIPTGDDFRVSLSEDEQARIAREHRRFHARGHRRRHARPVDAPLRGDQPHGKPLGRSGSPLPRDTGLECQRPRRAVASAQHR